jgi:hypothetical protein
VVLEPTELARNLEHCSYLIQSQVQIEQSTGFGTYQQALDPIEPFPDCRLNSTDLNTGNLLLRYEDV